MTNYTEVINIARCRIADLEDERERLLKALEEWAREAETAIPST